MTLAPGSRPCNLDDHSGRDDEIHSGNFVILDTASLDEGERVNTKRLVHNLPKINKVVKSTVDTSARTHPTAQGSNPKYTIKTFLIYLVKIDTVFL